jgi:hypothetical protein
MMKKARLSQMAQDLNQLQNVQPETHNTINTDIQGTIFTDNQHSIIDRVKATYTLPPNLLASLETGQTKLRTMVDPKVRGKINRSLLVELAIKAALSDLNTNGPESQIYRDTEYHLSVFTD